MQQDATFTIPNASTARPTHKQTNLRQLGIAGRPRLDFLCLHGNRQRLVHGGSTRYTPACRWRWPLAWVTWLAPKLAPWC